VVAGVPWSEVVKRAGRSRGSAEAEAEAEALAGEGSSLSARSLARSRSGSGLGRGPCVFLRRGWGMRHSMAKAVQLVQGMPSEAASQRTWAG